MAGPYPAFGTVRPGSPCPNCGAPRVERYDGLVEDPQPDGPPYEWTLEFPRHDNPDDCIKYLAAELQQAQSDFKAAREAIAEIQAQHPSRF